MAEATEKTKSVQDEHVETVEAAPMKTSTSEVEQAVPYEEDDKMTLKTKLAVFVSWSLLTTRTVWCGFWRLTLPVSHLHVRKLPLHADHARRRPGLHQR